MTNKTKQTAVEWLIEKQMDAGIGLPKEWREQAKEMEKEQIINAYDNGMFDGSMDDVNDRIYKNYYNETFKQEE